MKFLSIVLAFCFSLNIFAQTNTIEALEKSFNEYQYALTVEWDQKDENFLKEQNEIIAQKMTSLMSEGSASKEALLAFAEKKTGNKESFKALKLKVGLLSPSATAEEVIALMKSESKEFYSKGASWNGDVFGYALNAALILFAIYAVYEVITFECFEYSTEYRCETMASYNEYGGHSAVLNCGDFQTCVRSNRD